MATNKKVGLEIIVSATDKATAQFKEINKRFANSGLGRLQTSLTKLKGASRFNEISRAASNVNDELSSLIKKFTTLAVVGGGTAFYLTKSYSDFADKVSDTADILGESTTAYQQQMMTAQLAGVEQEAYNSSLFRFSKALGEAKLKGGPLLKILSRIGVNRKLLKNFDGSLNTVIEGLAKIGNANLRNAIGVKLFGKQFGQLVPMIKDFDRYRNAAKGFILSEEDIERGNKFQDQLKYFQTLLQSIRNMIGADLLEGFSEGLKVFSDFLIENRPQIREFFKAIGKEIPAAFRLLVSALKFVIGFFTEYDEKTKQTRLNMLRLKAVFAVFLIVTLLPLIGALIALGGALGAALPWVALFASYGAALFAAWDYLPEYIQKLALLGPVGAAVYYAWKPTVDLFKDLWGYVKSIGEKWSGIFSEENARGLMSKFMGPAPVVQYDYLQAAQGPVNNATASLNVKVQAPAGTSVTSSSNGYDNFSVDRGWLFE